MRLVADTHVHLYPCYDLYAAFVSAWHNLGGLDRDFAGKDILRVLFLTERWDCSVFMGLKQGKCLHPGFSVRPLAEEEGGLWLELGGAYGRLLLVPGRQIITRERLEVLALATCGRIADGHPLDQIIEEIYALQGVPILNWSPGKWLGRRGLAIRRLLETSPPHRFLIGDISMRPKVWGEPILMASARRRGFRIAAGSDPLPFSGEERRIGSFGVIGEAEINKHTPLSDLRRFLRSGNWKIAGKRDSLCTMFYRQWRNYVRHKEAKAVC